MIKPVNGHLLIQPLKHETFLPSEQGTYQEIGRVIEVADEVGAQRIDGANNISPVFLPAKAKKGDKVYFDSWLAAKFPAEKEGEFLWLVKWDDVRAVEAKDKISFENIDLLPVSVIFHEGKGDCGECNKDGTCRYGT